MKRQFEANGYFLENLNTCIYLQFVDECGERCRLLEEYYSPMSRQYTRKLLKARKIRETRSGEYYILLRGRRVRLDDFLRTGSAWSSLPENYTVEY